MTKNDIITSVSNRTGESPAVVRAIFESVIDKVKQGLINNDNIYLRGFGTLKNVKRAGRNRRDIRRQIDIYVKGKLKPFFKPCKKLVDEVNK